MKDKLKGLRGRKAWVGMLGVALVLALLMTAFPIHIEQGSSYVGKSGVLTVGRGQYHLTIGTPVSATTADYTCDGTDDDVQFQAALDALPASGGQLLVLTGDYDFENGTTVTRAIDDVSIIGVGASVSFTCDATTAIFTAGGNSWLFSNFETDAGGLAMGATTDWMWLNITIGTTYYALDTEDDPAVDTSGTPVDDDFAKFTDADTVEGRSYAEVRTDLGLVPDTDVPAQASFDDHSARHENAGADEISVAGLSGLLADDQHVLDAEVQAIKLDDFASPDDNTDLDASLTEHGLLLKLGGGTTNFLRADGTWAVPAGGGTVDTSGIPVTNDYARFTDADTIEGRSYAEVQADLSLEIGTDVLAEQTIGIADDNLVEVDDADAADDDYAKFTADGLEGRSYAEVRTDLGLVIGTNVQAYDAELTIIAGLSIADGNLMVGNGSTWVVESGATVRTSLGLGTGDSPQFTAVNVGAAADTTLARSSAGHVSVEGDVLLGESDVDDTPSDGDTSDPISSNWAYDHDADGSAHQSNVITITFVINGGGSAISTGEWGHLEIPFACTITQATLAADQSGSIVIDIWKDTYANFPPTDGDSITASAPPTISAAQKSQDSTLSGWTTAISAGDILAFNVDSCATIEIITLSIRATKT